MDRWTDTVDIRGERSHSRLWERAEAHGKSLELSQLPAIWNLIRTNTSLSAPACVIPCLCWASVCIRIDYVNTLLSFQDWLLVLRQSRSSLSHRHVYKSSRTLVLAFTIISESKHNLKTTLCVLLAWISSPLMFQWAVIITAITPCKLLTTEVAGLPHKDLSWMCGSPHILYGSIKHHKAVFDHMQSCSASPPASRSFIMRRQHFGQLCYLLIL